MRHSETLYNAQRHRKYLSDYPLTQLVETFSSNKVAIQAFVQQNEHITSNVDVVDKEIDAIVFHGETIEQVDDNRKDFADNQLVHSLILA